MEAARSVLFIIAGSLLAAAAAAMVPPPCPCLAQADARGLPLVELPAAHPSDTMAVLITGDGGWRAIDRDIAAGLNARGISVVGLVSPDYFSTRRTPEEASCALQRIIETFTIRWRADRVIVGGYSRGAGVAPFMISRLPPRWQKRVVAVALIGLEKTVGFEVSPVDVFRTHATPDEVPVQGEVEKLRGKRVLCFYGQRERDSLCRDLGLPLAVTFPQPGGHHFTGNYDDLARTIWRWSRS